MNLNELINKLCPDGVEYKKLGEVCDFLNGYAFKTKHFCSNGKYPVIKITIYQKIKLMF